MTVRDVWTLPTLHVGRTVTVYHEIDSTNSRAGAVAALPEGRGAAFLADRQTAGRGQHGRSWLAPPRSSVLLSLLVHPPPALARPVVLTAWAAVAVAEVVRSLTGERPRIKWPNDILVGGAKACGILIEHLVRGEQAVAVAGVGLNVAQTAEDFRDLPDATSLRRISGRDFDTDEVARALIARLDAEYDGLLSGASDLESRWAEGMGLVGEDVVAECGAAVRRGRLLGMTFDGILLAADGRTVALAPETIRQLRRDVPTDEV